MSENYEGPKRELHWWEHYPLHKVWCNDYLPLVPRFNYRPADQYNSWDAGVHWLCIHVWTMSHFSLGADVDISFNRVGFGVILPYLRIFIGFNHLYHPWIYKMSKLLSRDPEPIHYGDI